MNMKNKRFAKRLAALAVCALFAAVPLLSAVFVISHLNHEHDHDGPGRGCAVCAHVIEAESLLKRYSAAVAGAALVFACLPAVLSVLKPAVFTAGLTPVRLKTRLNN